MHAVIREYSGSGADKLFDVLEKKTAEVKAALMPVNGFVSYSLVRTAHGGISITICQDKAGTDESIRVARDGSQRRLAMLARPHRRSRKAQSSCASNAAHSRLPAAACPCSPPASAA